MTTMVVGTLDALAERINVEHGAVARAAQSALEHALNAGAALTEARQLVPEGEWEDWLTQNCALSITTARHYQRLATYREQLRGVDVDGPYAALRYLRGLPALEGRPGGVGYPESMREEARRLWNGGGPNGMSHREVARVLGVSRNAVRAWVVPEARARERRLSSARARERARREAEREQKRAALTRDARAAGGEIAAGYADLRRAIQRVDRAREATDDQLGRRGLGRVLTKLYAAEDELGDVLRERGERDG